MRSELCTIATDGENLVTLTTEESYVELHYST